VTRIRTITAVAAVVLTVAGSAAQAQSRRDRRDNGSANDPNGSGRDGSYRDGSYRDRRRDRTRDGDRSVERPASGTQPSATGPSSGPSGSMEDRYGVLLRRSIFARSGIAQRIDRPPATTSTAPSAPPLSPEQSVLFVGVIAQDEEYVAFAENQVTHQLMVLRTGDDVARGKVVAITLDTLAYGSGGAIKQVPIGHNLAGELVASSLASGAATAGSPTSAPSTAGMTPEQAAMMERLRQRRLSGQ
jgi:hypothetical protein